MRADQFPSDRVCCSRCGAVVCPENPPPKRQTAREAVDAFVAEWTGARAAVDVLRRCEEGQVPCGPLLSIAEIFTDPHYAARENRKRLPVEGLGAIMVPNVVPKLSATPGSVDSAGPPLGAHTDEILSQPLGFDAEQLQELRGAQGHLDS